MHSFIILIFFDNLSDIPDLKKKSLCSVTYRTVCSGVIYISNKSKYLKTVCDSCEDQSLWLEKLFQKVSLKPIFSFHTPFKTALKM